MVFPDRHILYPNTPFRVIVLHHPHQTASITLGGVQGLTRLQLDAQASSGRAGLRVRRTSATFDEVGPMVLSTRVFAPAHDRQRERRRHPHRGGRGGRPAHDDRDHRAHRAADLLGRAAPRHRHGVRRRDEPHLRRPGDAGQRAARDRGDRRRRRRHGDRRRLRALHRGVLGRPRVSERGPPLELPLRLLALHRHRRGRHHRRRRGSRRSPRSTSGSSGSRSRASPRRSRWWRGA